MNVISAVLPVILMLLIGVFCRKKNILTVSGVNEIKALIANIILPVVLVNALGNANYDGNTLVLVGLILLVEIAAMGIGFVLKRLVDKKYQDIVPALVTTVENGMLGYPLYMILCGSEALGNMATLDIAVTGFGFTIWSSFITQVDSGKKMNIGDSVKLAMKNPCLWGVIVGILCGVTGILPVVIASPYGSIYTEILNLISAPLSAMILIALGFDLCLHKELVKETIKLVFIRLGTQLLLFAGVWFSIGKSMEKEMQIAIILFFFLPVAFSSQIYAKREETRLLISTFASIYSILTIGAFVVMSMVLL